jgi:hypothetical protein
MTEILDHTPRMQPFTKEFIALRRTRSAVGRDLDG